MKAEKPNTIPPEIKKLDAALLFPFPRQCLSPVVVWKCVRVIFGVTIPGKVLLAVIWAEVEELWWGEKLNFLKGSGMFHARKNSHT